MAKRFISTELFNDVWFQELSKDGKLFFIYFITTCDHAGVLRLNRKLFTFQTEIDDINSCLTELKSVLIDVKNDVYCMPKFLAFQYPGFPKSKVKQQEGALKILAQYNLIEIIEKKLKTSLTLTKELNNSYVNDNDNDNVNKINFEIFQKFFNEKCGNITKIQYLTKNRKALLLDINSRYGKEAIFKVILICGKSKYLQYPDNSFKPNFDWIFKEDNFIKILEGQYSEQEIKMTYNMKK